MTEIQLTEHVEQPTAVVRERVALGDLPQFFGRAYHATMAAIQAQGLHPTGPPFSKYLGKPTGGVADVEAGFPVSGAISDADGVIAGTLPGGKVVEAMHVGPYDTMQQTYEEVMRFVAERGLAPSDEMWEVYLSDPQTEPDPAGWRTQIFWPVAE
jgi:effector-binding domain-containing protein